MLTPAAVIRLVSAPEIRRRVFRRYALDQAAIDPMARTVAQTYVSAYEQRLRQLSRAVGSTSRPKLTDTKVLQRVARDSRDAAAGIVSTYNDDLRRFLDTQPRTASQRELATAVREWKTAREGWKTRQIAKTTTMLGRNDADRDVVSKNKIEVQARVTPREAAEPRCSELAARGWINFSDIDFALPLHPNCVHSFEYRTPLREALKDQPVIWMGDNIRRRPRKDAAA